MTFTKSCTFTGKGGVLFLLAILEIKYKQKGKDSPYRVQQLPSLSLVLSCGPPALGSVSAAEALGSSPNVGLHAILDLLQLFIDVTGA